MTTKEMNSKAKYTMHIDSPSPSLMQQQSVIIMTNTRMKIIKATKPPSSLGVALCL